MRFNKNKNIKWWVRVISCGVLFVFIGTFAYMKMGFLIKGVQISASINKNSNSPLVKVTGNAKNAIYLSLNGREIFIDKDGTYSEHVALLPGLSVLTLDAKDKFGNTREKTLEVIYEESTGAVAVGGKIINTN
ncbi:MAG: hypothetical protein AAB477_00870 [Patescibacteria group bacterium]